MNTYYYSNSESDSDSLLLNYKDACMYQSDVQILKSKTAWLNDACIHYHMKRLESDDYHYRLEQDNCNDDDDDDDDKDHGTRTRYSPRTQIQIEYLDPSIVSFFMHQLSIQDEDDHAEMVQLCQTWNHFSTMTYPSGDNHVHNQQTKNRKKKDEPNEEEHQGRNENESCSKLKLVLLPINDNNSATYASFQTPGSGNHWSLLVLVIVIADSSDNRNDNKSNTNQNNNNYEKVSSSSSPKQPNDTYLQNSDEHTIPSILSFYHFDSSNGMNSSSAHAVSNKIQHMYSLLPSLKEQNQKDTSSSGKPNKVIECKTPQQQNGYDCGIHTLAAATAIQQYRQILAKDLSVDDNNIDKVDFVLQKKEIKIALEKSVHDFVEKYHSGSVHQMARTMRESIILDLQSIASKNGG